MKVGVSTISWGIQITDINRVLNAIASCGYQGVEFPQRPDSLGVKDIKQLKDMLDDKKLSLLTFNGGTLKERVDFCGDIHPEYLYVEHWDLDNIPYAISKGFRVAFHPRVFAPNGRLDEILGLISTYDNLNIILDVAHSWIAKDDPINAIKQLHSKLVAVHLKDWRSDFGRSKYRFARGFTLLGKGEVKLDSIVTSLKEVKFGGWIVAEMDHAQISPYKSIQANARWLSQKDILRKTTFHYRNEVFDNEDTRPSLEREVSFEAEARFREELMNAMTNDSETYYEGVAKAYSYLLKTKFIRVSTYHSSEDIEFVTPRAWYPQHLDSKPQRSNLRNALTGIAIERQSPATIFDLTDPQPGARYGYPQCQFHDPNLRDTLRLKTMISLPIYNSGNQNAVKIIVNIFPEDDERIFSNEEWYRISKAVTQTLDSMLDSHCMSAAAKVNRLAGRSENATYFLRNLVDLIQETLRCEGVALFLVNEKGDKLELLEGVRTHTEWKVSSGNRFYRKGENKTGKVWERNEVLIIDPREDDEDHKGKSTEIVPSKHLNHNLYVPLLNPQGEVIGVIRCRNKISIPNAVAPGSFSNDDAAVLDAIVQASAPHIFILQSDDLRLKALRLLMHEMRNPLFAIQSTIDILRHDDRLNKLLEYDYVEDIWFSSELMKRLMLNANWFKYSGEPLPIEAVPTLIMAEIVAPAIKQINPLLKAHGFSKSNISYGSFEQIPALYVDPYQFQQVIFNLLANAIKHGFESRNSFHVEIDGLKIKSGFCIRFRDYGPGVDESIQNLIFQEGFRGPGSVLRNVSGEGLGLWVVKQIVEAHNGQILITNIRFPFEFTIILPEFLAYRPPLTYQKERRS